MFKRCTAILLTILVSLASGVAVNAQGPQEKFDQDAITKIKEEGMNHSQVMDTLSYITDAPGARLTGPPNIRAAQEWAKQKLAAWGLQTSRLDSRAPFGRACALH